MSQNITLNDETYNFLVEYHRMFQPTKCHNKCLSKISSTLHVKETDQVSHALTL